MVMPLQQIEVLSMSNLSKLTLTTTTPNQPLTALAHKRIKLIRKLDQQLLAAECASEGMEHTEEIKRWVKSEQTGEKELITQSRQVKKWWWANEHGALMLTLKDGNKIIPLDDNHKSVEVGGIGDLAGTIETVRAAVIAGELDNQLNKLIAERKPFGKNKKTNTQTAKSN